MTLLVTRPRRSLALYPALGLPVTGGAPVDIEETSEAFLIELDLPGVAPGDVQIELRDSELRVWGSFKERQRDGTLRHQARRTGEFEYLVALPGDVDADNVSADLDGGVLTIVAPKLREQATRRIAVGARADAASDSPPDASSGSSPAASSGSSSGTSPGTSSAPSGAAARSGSSSGAGAGASPGAGSSPGSSPGSRSDSGSSSGSGSGSESGSESGMPFVRASAPQARPGESGARGGLPDTPAAQAKQMKEGQSRPGPASQQVGSANVGSTGQVGRSATS
ncbi:Hsp20/alpha crystallin family protein [Dactylosporangium matsuzakiense]|uniref:SHSP domain-containing protein n=1 Tax=Dactylosporangium matsuzakiense TaxID=53360 RepID=A0A9W6KP37_9ACTN|nr:Hsp20/alpha crystallin family protein [Dactylosporangium matsuzakiense]UWZ46944.1 Hsp20/alpha crystallin family protein [Dactylosporangium matsuzakiense]GLL04159.1 hypothetical protein GCM10017581_059060 [Dactylosporangium matsuzakiense]